MCARYTVYSEEEIIELRQIIIEAERKIFAGQTPAAGEVRPADTAPVVTRGGAAAMKWGFPGIAGKGLIRHARSETVMDKKLFAEAARSRRCAVPATGFFEWGSDREQLSLLGEASGKPQKRKYLFTLPGADFFYLAGLYDRQGRFVIMTREADGAAAEIHDRMPVILPPDGRGAWLEDGLAPGLPRGLDRKAV
jgi:putative SOS response-associated peptidase YedK